jgi:outer membrane protein
MMKLNLIIPVKLKTIIVAGVALLLPMMVVAQDTGSYTLSQLLEVALRNNNNLVKANLDIEEGKQKTREVTAAAYPQINVNGELNDNVIRQAMVFPKAFADPNAGPDEYMVLRAGMKYGASVNIQASQQLLNMQVLTGIKAAEESENYYNLNRERIEEEVIRQVAALWYQAAAYKAQRTVLQGNLQEVNSNLKIAQARFENGLVRKVDVDRLKVSATNLQTQINVLNDNYQKAVNQLKLAAGLESDATLAITEPLLSQDAHYTYDTALVASEWSFDEKIESKQLRTQLALYSLERKSFSAGYYPTISAYGNYSYQGQTNNFFLSEKANPLWFDIASVGVKVSVPVFDGFQKSAKIQQSKIRRSKTERDLLYTKKQSSMEYENARNTFVTNYQNYLAQKDNVALANSVYDVTQQNFNEGISPLTDLMQAETSRLQAQNQLINALLNVKQAEIDLLKAKGEIRNLVNQ